MEANFLKSQIQFRMDVMKGEAGKATPSGSVVQVNTLNNTINEVLQRSKLNSEQKIEFHAKLIEKLDTQNEGTKFSAVVFRKFVKDTELEFQKSKDSNFLKKMDSREMERPAVLEDKPKAAVALGKTETPPSTSEGQSVERMPLPSKESAPASSGRKQSLGAAEKRVKEDALDAALRAIPFGVQSATAQAESLEKLGKFIAARTPEEIELLRTLEKFTSLMTVPGCAAAIANNLNGEGLALLAQNKKLGKDLSAIINKLPTDNPQVLYQTLMGISDSATRAMEMDLRSKANLLPADMKKAVITNLDSSLIKDKAESSVAHQLVENKRILNHPNITPEKKNEIEQRLDQLENLQRQLSTRFPAETAVKDAQALVQNASRLSVLTFADREAYPAAVTGRPSQPKIPQWKIDQEAAKAAGEAEVKRAAEKASNVQASASMAPQLTIDDVIERLTVLSEKEEVFRQLDALKSEGNLGGLVERLGTGEMLQQLWAFEAKSVPASGQEARQERLKVILSHLSKEQVAASMDMSSFVEIISNTTDRYAQVAADTLTPQQLGIMASKSNTGDRVLALRTLITKFEKDENLNEKLVQILTHLELSPLEKRALRSDLSNLTAAFESKSFGLQGSNLLKSQLKFKTS